MKKTILSLLVALMATTGAWAQTGDVTMTGSKSGSTYNYSGTFAMPAYDVEVSTELWYKLSQTNDNTALADKTDVFLERTLSNSTWSTFCAPFNAAIPSGWTVKELSSTAFSAGTLTLNFSDAKSIVKGTPYLVKADVEDPTFEGVTQDWTTTHEVTATGGYATFVPVLTPTTLNANDKTKLYLGGNNTLYYPSQNVQVKGFRAYFQLNNGLTAGDPQNGARAFVLNLGNHETGIQTLAAPATITDGGTYDLSGRRVGSTTRKGVYIRNGQKVVLK